jgi:hypothetical protein
MATFIDVFGATVTGNSDGTWTRGSITVGPCNRELAASTFSGMTPQGWVAPIVPTTVLTAEGFINRFSQAEEQAILTAAQTSWQISLWLSKELSATTVDVTDSLVVSGMAAVVGAGLVSAARSAVILDLSQPSP